MERRAPGRAVPRPRSLMENLLVAKMERARLCPAPLMRMDSTDSAYSVASSSSLASEVCRCDDCLLGIADLHLSSQELQRKVVALSKVKLILQLASYLQPPAPLDVKGPANSERILSINNRIRTQYSVVAKGCHCTSSAIYVVSEEVACILD